MFYRKYCLIDGFLASLKRTIRRFQLPLCHQSKRQREKSYEVIVIENSPQWAELWQGNLLIYYFFFLLFHLMIGGLWIFYLLLFNKMPNNHIMNTYSSLTHQTIFSILFHWSSTVQLHYNKPSGKMDFILYI